MAPQDHNRTLGMIYSFLGAVLAVAALVELIRVIILARELERIQADSLLQILIAVALLLMIFLYAIAYGLFRKRHWARIATLISSGLFVWLFPLGTALAIYTWSFMHSEGGKSLYSRSST
jgi:drug/metabolite transporter (DMT)-like permease